jgi:hypothetical protein
MSSRCLRRRDQCQLLPRDFLSIADESTRTHVVLLFSYRIGKRSLSSTPHAVALKVLFTLDKSPICSQEGGQVFSRRGPEGRCQSQEVRVSTAELSLGGAAEGYTIAEDTAGVDSKAGWTNAGADVVSTPGEATPSRRRFTSRAPFLSNPEHKQEALRKLERFNAAQSPQNHPQSVVYFSQVIDGGVAQVVRAKDS